MTTTAVLAKPVLQGLYAITDSTLIPEKPFFRYIEAAITGGARIIQYRDKSHDTDKRLTQATTLAQLCKNHHVLFIVNDDIHLAQQCHADGVHLGAEDTSILQARAILGEQRIIGISCYNDMALAIQAYQAGADYIAFGAFYTSPTKPQAPQASIHLLSTTKQQLNIPICAIGGITSNNAQTLIHAGADMLAVISDIFKQSTPESVAKHAKKISDLFNTYY